MTFFVCKKGDKPPKGMKEITLDFPSNRPVYHSIFCDEFKERKNFPFTELRLYLTRIVHPFIWGDEMGNFISAFEDLLLFNLSNEGVLTVVPHSLEALKNFDRMITILYFYSDKFPKIISFSDKDIEEGIMAKNLVRLLMVLNIDLDGGMEYWRHFDLTLLIDSIEAYAHFKSLKQDYLIYHNPIFDLVRGGLRLKIPRPFLTHKLLETMEYDMVLVRRNNFPIYLLDQKIINYGNKNSPIVNLTEAMELNSTDFDPKDCSHVIFKDPCNHITGWFDYEIGNEGYKEEMEMYMDTCKDLWMDDEASEVVFK